MRPDFHYDDREFGRALEFVERTTGRTAKESINRAGLHVIIGGKGFKGAMQLTPKAARSKIKAVSHKEIAGYVAAKLRSKGLVGGSGRQWSSKQFANAMRFERKRRLRAVGYTAFAGWNNAARAFGGRGLKGVTASGKKLARFGYGKKAATTINPEAILTNTAPMAERIGLIPLQMAITNVARDLVEYATRKLQKNFNEVNK